MYICTNGRTAYTEGQQRKQKRQNMPDRDTVSGIYRTLRLQTNMEKPTECFKVKALYPGYNYLQTFTTFSIY